MVSLLKTTLRTTGALFLLAAGAAGAIVGCSTTDASGPDPLASVEGFCEQYAIAKCSAPIVSNCYGAVGASLDADTNSCIAATETLDRCNPSGLPYHEENAANSLATIAQVYSDGEVDGPEADDNELADLADALDSVFYKALPENTTCTANNDCDYGSGAACVIHAGKGTCQFPVEATPGDSCALISAQCDPNYYCGTELACIAVQGTSAPCHDDTECGSGKCGASGHCATLIRDGLSCSLASECAGGFCLFPEGDTMNGHCSGDDTFSATSASCESLRR
ncbi:MAG TPA: hypothetical protein VGM56_14905 [Byssovorax sp.]|jgi:hypothetical protein